MAPMSRYCSPDGILTGDMAAYYARRAENEVALIITEGAAVERPAAVENPAVPKVYGELPMAAWKKAVDAVHAAGSKIAPQLWHVGAWQEYSGWTPPGPFEGPSGLKFPGLQTGLTMSESDIADTIGAFATAARNAKNVGFDAINIHGAHGYLIDQFYWAETNTRTDKWGGKTLKERGRFANELIKAIRKAVGEDLALIMRISQWRLDAYERRMAPTAQALEDWVGPLADAGVDVFDCSQRRFWEPEFAGSDLNFAGWVKKVSGKATMTVGSVGLTVDLMDSLDMNRDGSTMKVARPSSIAELERRFDRGDFDLVAVGRALITDPQWVRKIREGRTAELREFKAADLATLS
jgi:2,4-dienoyl-CoA reductase-like NADH-dependent reductase (Old Yellow Enzyme family)